MFAPLVPLLLLGCGGEEPAQGTLDARVDHAGDAVESLAPTSCLAENARLYVVWEDARAGSSGIWFNTSTDGGDTWMPADVRLDTGAVGAFRPSLACDGERAWVVWEDERDGQLRNRNIYAARTTDGGRTWSEHAVPLDGDTDGAAMSRGPRVIAVEDAVYVTWFDSRSGAYDILLQASLDRGASWRAQPVRVDSDGVGEAYSAWPQVAANAAGDVVVAWEDARSGASDIYVNQSSDFGASFPGGDTRLDLGADGSDSFLPQLAMDEDLVAVAWHDSRDGEGRTVLVSASRDGGVTWPAAPVTMDVDEPGASDSLGPSLVVAGGVVHVAWQDASEGGYDVRYRRSEDGGASFGDAARLDADRAGEAQSYDAVLRVLGEKVVVGWADRRDDASGVGFNDLYYAYSDDGGATWSQQDFRVNSNAPGSAWARDLQVQLRGETLVAIWADGRSGSSDVLAARRKLGEESVYMPPPPKKEE
jgi:Neuraminidase (sialidase)